MSEAKKELRSYEAVQQEYMQICCKAGDMQYRISAFERELKVLNDRLRELNFESISIQNAEAEKQRAAQAEPKTEAPALSVVKE